MAVTDWKNAPADPGATRAVAANGLEYRVIDTGDAAVFDPYLQAEMRGFLAGEQSDEQLGGARDGLAFRRFVGCTTRTPSTSPNRWAPSIPG